MATQAVIKAGQKDIVRDGAFDLTPRSLSEAFQLAEMMSKSELVPANFRNKPADVLIAVQYGAELGLPPLQALSSIAVINGRATIWGDGLLGLVLNSGAMENYKEMTCEEIEAAGKAVFWVKRKGVAEPIIREFSIEDAKKAKLWNNGSKPIWINYPWRMLQMRARSWALRDGFADVLKGLQCREEVEDCQPVEAPRALAMPRRKSEAQQIPEQTAQAPESQPATNEPPTMTLEDLEGMTSEPPQPQSHTGRVISDKQRKRMYAIARNAGMNDDQFKQEIIRLGFNSSADITMDAYEDICTHLESFGKV